VSFNFRIIIFVDTLCTHLLFILEVNFNFQSVMRIETQGLKNKVFKTQGPEVYLTLYNILYQKQ